MQTAWFIDEGLLSLAMITLTGAIYASHINFSSDHWKWGLWKRGFQLLAAPNDVLKKDSFKGTSFWVNNLNMRMAHIHWFCFICKIYI